MHIFDEGGGGCLTGRWRPKIDLLEITHCPPPTLIMLFNLNVYCRRNGEYEYVGVSWVQYPKRYAQAQYQCRGVYFNENFPPSPFVLSPDLWEIYDFTG